MSGTQHHSIVIIHNTSTNLTFPFNMFAFQERLDLATNKHALTNPGQLPQETFVLFTMIGVTMFALLSIWYTVQSSYRYTSKGTKESTQQISRRVYSITCLALIIQFLLSVNMLPVGFMTLKYPSAPEESQVSFGQNSSSGVYMIRNLTTMGSFRHQVVPRSQKRHRNSQERLWVYGHSKWLLLDTYYILSVSRDLVLGTVMKMILYGLLLTLYILHLKCFRVANYIIKKQWAFSTCPRALLLSLHSICTEIHWQSQLGQLLSSFTSSLPVLIN
jgi:hypothetical protein